MGLADFAEYFENPPAVQAGQTDATEGSPEPVTESPPNPATLTIEAPRDPSDRVASEVPETSPRTSKRKTRAPLPAPTPKKKANKTLHSFRSQITESEQTLLRSKDRPELEAILVDYNRKSVAVLEALINKADELDQLNATLESLQAELHTVKKENESLKDTITTAQMEKQSTLEFLEKTQQLLKLRDQEVDQLKHQFIEKGSNRSS